jgi:hypothetical protein
LPLEHVTLVLFSSLALEIAWSCNPITHGACIATIGGSKSVLIYTYIHTCMHVYIVAYIHAYIHVYIHTCIHAYIHIHACIHTYICTYIHNTCAHLVIEMT